MKAALETAKELMAHFDQGNPAATFPDKETPGYDLLEKELRFITAKKIIYGANVDEEGLAEDNAFVTKVREYAAAKGADVIKLCSKIEEEMAGLEDEERQEFLESMGVEESGLDQIIRKSFHILGLISYFTAGVKEVRAWTIRDGWKAPKAASVIHNDFEKGFIRAEVISYEDFIKNGGEAKSKEAGAMRLEGKEYVVKDGDVMHFRFNV